MAALQAESTLKAMGDAGGLNVSKISRWVGIAFLVSSIPGSAALAHSGRATELETRLFAPCCYVQTLDVHESDLADRLRHEIEQRLSGGEPPLQIEDDLVTRYGERIRAVPRDVDPRADIPLVVGIALGLGLLGLAVCALRWRRNQRRERADISGGVSDAKYDRELDDALRSE